MGWCLWDRREVVVVCELEMCCRWLVWYGKWLGWFDDVEIGGFE